MNKIVRECPASELPPDWKEGVDPNSIVTVTIEEKESPSKSMSLEEIFASRKPPFRTKEEIDAWIREQRDEWDH